MQKNENRAKTLKEELDSEQKYWRKNSLWTILIFVGIFLWSYLNAPGLSVVPGADALSLTDHNGQVVTVAYSEITEAELMEEPQYGTMLTGTDQKDGKTGTWEHPQWGSYTLCVYNSCPSAVRIQSGENCYVINLASRNETEQLYQLIQEIMPASK